MSFRKGSKMIRRIATSIGKNEVGSIMVLDLGLVEKCLNETPFSGFRKVITKIENVEISRKNLKL